MNHTHQSGLFTNRCPECGETPIFRGLYSMNAKCERCGNKYEKEQGYFIGAMMASYFFSTLLILPTLLICIFAFELSFPAAIGIGLLQLILMQPVVFRFSRLFWINLETKMSRKL